MGEEDKSSWYPGWGAPHQTAGRAVDLLPRQGDFVVITIGALRELIKQAWYEGKED